MRHFTEKHFYTKGCFDQVSHNTYHLKIPISNPMHGTYHFGNYVYDVFFMLYSFLYIPMCFAPLPHFLCLLPSVIVLIQRFIIKIYLMQ